MTRDIALRPSVIHTYVSLATQSPGAKIESIEGVTMCRSAIKHPIGNFAIDFAGTTLPPEVVNEALARNHFRLYFLPGDSPQDLERLAETAGLRLRYELAGMALATPCEGEADVREAVTAEEALSVATFITETFFWRSPPKSRATLAGIMAASHPDHRYFYEEDKKGILAAGTLTLDAEVIGLYNLCVRGDARSRGVGSSFAAELGRRAKASAEHVTLLCDWDLIPWYSRQGYVQVGSLRAFGA